MAGMEQPAHLPAALQPDDVEGSALLAVDAKGLPLSLKDFTNDELSLWRAGPNDDTTPGQAVKCLQV